MGMNNRVQLIGHLGADPEIKRLNNGNTIVNMRMATSERWRDKNTGDMKEKTEWHNVVVFNENLTKVCENYLRKGSKLGVVGKLRTRDWEDQGGNKRYTTEVVLENFDGEIQMLDTKAEGEARGGGGGGGGRRNDRDDRRDDRGGGRDYGRESGSRGGSGRQSDFDDEDSIPF